MGTGIKKDRRAAGVAERNGQNGQVQRATFTAREGILPPPEEMERYEQLTPGITDRLMVTYEKQVDHRISLESKVVDSDIKKSNIGQVAAFIISMTAIIGGIYLITIGKDITGFVAMFGTLATLAAVFFTAQKSRKNERERKR